jgi:hypothetical protein
MVILSTVAHGCHDQTWAFRSPAMVTSRCILAEAMRASGPRNQFQSQIAIRIAMATTSVAATPLEI